MNILPLNSNAIIDGDTVYIRYVNDKGIYDVITLSRPEYDEIKGICTDGMLINSFVIRPSAINRYLSGGSAASIDTAIDIEKTRMKRNMGKAMMDIMPYAIFVFLVLCGIGALYMMVNQGNTGGTGSAVASTGSTVAKNMLAVK